MVHKCTISTFVVLGEGKTNDKSAVSSLTQAEVKKKKKSPKCKRIDTFFDPGKPEIVPRRVQISGKMRRR